MIRLGGTAVALGMGAAILWGCGEAAAAPDTSTPDRATASVAKSSAPQRVSPERRSKRARTAPVAHAVTSRTGISVRLPQLPTTGGASFTISADAISAVASDYVAAGGDPTDSARFFFGDLAVSSLQTLASPDITPDQVRTQLGNLAVSGYFGGIWLRDNLRDAPATPAPAPSSAPVDLTISKLGIGLFDAVAAGLTGAAATGNTWITTTVAHVSVPVLLTLYGYNRGYLDVILRNPPAGVPSMQDTLSCRGFLNCCAGGRYSHCAWVCARAPSGATSSASRWRRAGNCRVAAASPSVPCSASSDRRCACLRWRVASCSRGNTGW